MTPETAETQAETPIEKPLRRDAERNRLLILEAGRQLFAERGLSVTLDDIAERAGVGVGTVYRRFPDRDALVDALFKEKIDGVVARAEAAERLEDPWEGLATFMRGHLLDQMADRAFASVVLTDEHGHDQLMRGKAQIAPIVARIVQRAKEAGVVRADLAFTDIPMLMLMCGASLDATRDLAPDVWERYFQILLDGIRPSSTSPLGAPLPDADVPEAMRCGLSKK